jgi:CRP/FNR family transcriptional regulator, nitrogen fixation regulation protein
MSSSYWMGGRRICVGEYAMLEIAKGHSNSGLEDRNLRGPIGEKGFWRYFKYRRSTEIFGEAEPADYVYQITSGAVRTFELLADGRRQIRAFHLPGDIFGVETGDAHRNTAEAIIDTTVRIARRTSIFGDGQKDISSTREVLKLITRNLHHAESHLMLLGRQIALERVAAFLVEMDERLQSPSALVLPMVRRDIADYLGLTLETVSRTLSELQRRGILTLQGGRNHREIVLHHRQKLARLALLRLAS